MGGNWKGYTNGKVYEASQLARALQEAFEESEVELVTKGKIQYFNIPASFDIETSSFMVNNDLTGSEMKAACMYIWQLGINGTVIYGRTWDEFIETLNVLVDYLNLSEKGFQTKRVLYGLLKGTEEQRMDLI